MLSLVNSQTTPQGVLNTTTAINDTSSTVITSLMTDNNETSTQATTMDATPATTKLQTDATATDVITEATNTTDGMTMPSQAATNTTDGMTMPSQAATNTTDSMTMPSQEATTPGGTTTAPQESRPLVNTTTGMVAGLTKTVPFPGVNVTLDSYLGIPYAEPPIGELRFAKPQPHASWTDTVFEALQYGPYCPQEGNPTGTDEDCLSLNVYVPRQDGSTSDPLPVMFWIHGGSFSFSSGADTPGDILSTFGNVIVVTINYRLGVFGFLSTGDDCARGNWGIWDQRLALQWVKDNADRFGGDPNKITIFGNSAGGNSVLYHVLSPLNEGLFQRAIIQSSVDVRTISVDGNIALGAAQLLGQSLGFDKSNDTNHLLRYLRQNATMDEIYSASLTVPVSFLPVVDDEIVWDMNKADASTAMNQYDVLLGVNNGDASAYYPDDVIIPLFTKEEFTDTVTNFVDAFCKDLDRCEGRDAAIQATTFAYNDLQNLNMANKLNTIRTFGLGFEAGFESHASDVARLHALSHSGNTYVYKFAYNDTEFYRPGVPRDVVPSPVHVEELFYVFGAVLTFNASTPQQAGLSFKFMSYWTNFARNGYV